MGLAYFSVPLYLTGLDTLREQLEYEHRRLDEARDAALKEAIEE